MPGAGNAWRRTCDGLYRRRLIPAGFRLRLVVTAWPDPAICRRGSNRRGRAWQTDVPAAGCGRAAGITLRIRRMGGRVVEGSGLEMRQSRYPLVPDCPCRLGMLPLARPIAALSCLPVPSRLSVSGANSGARNAGGASLRSEPHARIGGVTLVLPRVCRNSGASRRHKADHRRIIQKSSR
jgi:hypothetical protein